MKKDEFTSFKKGSPDIGKWVVVTNNIGAKNHQGEMSHVWLTNFIQRNDSGMFFTFIAGGYQKAEYLSHWKYA